MEYKQRLLLLISGILLMVLGYSCSQSKKNTDQILVKIDSLRKQIDQIKPGFGEIMGGIQTHHAKLWFAGINKNWALTEFEIHEIEENIEKIETLYPEDPRIQTLSMIDPALDSLEIATKAKQVEKLRKSFSFLTKTCNNCHRANGYEFNIITIPDRPPVPNQQFKPEKPK